MALIAGIDEAGLGPVLGPLVVSAVAFRVPDEAADQSMWRMLAGTVTKKSSKKRPGAIAIGDSKKLYNRRRAGGLEALERGVLSMLATRKGICPSLGGMLAIICPGAAGLLRQYPWYAHADLPLPRCLTPTDLNLSTNALRVAMGRAGVRLETMRCETIFAGEFNRLIDGTRNKATAAFGVTARLLMYLCEKFPDGPLRIHVDRQGGRMRYMPALQRIFDGAGFKIIDEGPAGSAYHIDNGRRVVELSFTVKAEQRHLPVALASMTSKYLRELFMTLFNGFWAQHVAELKPTAGYYTDGNRFYEQIAPAVASLGVDTQLVYRCR